MEARQQNVARALYKSSFKRKNAHGVMCFYWRCFLENNSSLVRRSARAAISDCFTSSWNVLGTQGMFVELTLNAIKRLLYGWACRLASGIEYFLSTYHLIYNYWFTHWKNSFGASEMIPFLCQHFVYILGQNEECVLVAQKNLY